MQLISNPDLLSQIVHLKIKDEKQFEKLPNQYRSIFDGKSYYFPIISISEFKSIQKRIKNEAPNISVSEIVDRLTSFQLTYNTTFYQDLCPRNQLSASFPDYSAAIIFHLFLAFFKSSNTNKDSIPLINSLISVLTYSQNLKYIPKFKSIAISILYYLYHTILDKKMVTTNEEYISLLHPLTKILTFSEDFPPEVFDIVIKFANILISPTDQQLSQIGKEFLNFVTIWIRTCDQKFPLSIITNIISILRLVLNRLDENALLFFSRCITFVNPADSIPTVLSFPDSLITCLENYRKTNKLTFVDASTLSGDKLPELPQRAVQLTFSPIEQSDLPPKIAAEKPPVIEKNQTIPDEIRNKCELIAKVVQPSLEIRNQLTNVVFEKIKDFDKPPFKYEHFWALTTLLMNLSPFNISITQYLYSMNYVYDQRLYYSKVPLPHDYQYISQIRDIVSSLLMRQESSVIKTMFEHMRTKPFLFPEFAYRNTPQFIPKSIFRFSFEQVAISTASASYYYKLCLPEPESKIPLMKSIQFSSTLSTIDEVSENDDESDNEIQLDKNLKPVLIKARVTCFQVIGKILDDSEYLVRLFESPQFISLSLGFFFEEPARQFLIPYLEKYFKTPNSHSNQMLINELIKIIITAITDNYTPFAFKLLIDFTSFLNAIITNNNDLAKEFDEIIPIISEWIVKMPKCEDGQTLLFEIISMFSAFFCYHKMDQSDISTIETASKNMFGDENSDKLDQKLIDLLAAKPNVGSSSFIIRQPKVLQLFIALNYDTKKIVRITKLCKFSPINAYMCKIGQVDSFIIEKLFNLRTEKDMDTFTALLQLFVEIAKVSSSVSIVNQYISLFTAINGNLVSEYHLMLITTLIGLCETSKFSPVSVLSDITTTVTIPSSLLNSNYESTPRALSDTQIAVMFWILNSTDDAAMKVVEISETVAFKIHNKKLWVLYHKPIESETNQSQNDVISEVDDDDVYFEDNGTAQDAEIKSYEKEFANTEIPTNKWTHIAVSLRNKKGKTYYFLAINGVYTEFISVGCSTRLFGKNRSISFYSSDSIILGPLGIYPYFKINPKTKQNTPLYTIDCRSRPTEWKEKNPELPKVSINLNPVVYITPHSHNSTMNYEKYPDDFPGTIEKIVKKSYDIISFIDVLAERCGVSLLLPLFGQIDMNIYEKQKKINYLPFLIELIKKVFMINPIITQSDFIQDRGVQILAHLFKEFQVNNLDNKFCQDLISLYSTLTNIELKKQFMVEIFLNWEIWINSPINSIKYIVTNLFPSFFTSDSVLEVLPKIDYIPKFLTIFRRYLYFRIQEQNLSFTGNRFHQSGMIDLKSIQTIRESLIGILRNIIQKIGILEKDFLFLLGEIFTVVEEEQREDLMKLMISIVNDNQINDIDNLYLITYLVQNIQFSIEIMNIFARFIPGITVQPNITKHAVGVENPQQTNNSKQTKSEQSQESRQGTETTQVEQQVKPKAFLTKDFLQGLVQVVIRNIPKDLFDLAYIDSVKKMISNPAFFPVITYIGLNTGKLKEIIEIYRDPHLLEQVYEYPFWFIWLTVSCFVGESQLQFLIRTPPKEWLPIFLSLDFIGRIVLQSKKNLKKTEINSEIAKIKKSFLVTLAGSGQLNSKEKVNAFLYLCKLYLFYQLPEEPVLRQLPPTPSPKTNNNGNLEPSKRAHRTIFTRSSRLSLSRRSTHASITFNNESPVVNSAENTNQLTQFDFDCEAPSVLSSPSKLGFGIRTSQTGEWTDKDFAKKILEKWYPNRESSKTYYVLYDDIIFLILSFVLPNLKDQAKNEYTNKIDFNLLIEQWKSYKPVNQNNENNIDQQLLNKINVFLENIGMLADGEMTTDESSRIASNYIMNIYNDYNTEYQRFVDSYRNEILNKGYNSYIKVKGRVDTELSEIVNTLNQDFIANMEREQSESKKAWNHFWHQVTNENAPWYQSLAANERDFNHFKRDSTACFCFCPFKETKNFTFDDHKNHSLARDTGNQHEANEQYKQFVEEQKKKYEKSAPPQIFSRIEVVDDKQDLSTTLCGSYCDFDCQVITVMKTIDATFYAKKDEILIYSPQIAEVIPYASIRYIFRRTYLQKTTAIEIFLKNGNSLLVNFINLKSHAILIELVNVIKENHPDLLDNSIQFIQDKRFLPFFHSTKFTEMWQNGLMSNFEYLMHLNVFSGRTFNNSSQYPIMPWVLTNFTINELNLSDESIFRDFSKPVGALNPELLRDYLNDYESYKEEGIEPFMFSSAPISPLSLYNYLIRQEPFTTLHIEIQGGRFDNPARLFSSLAQSFETLTHLKGDFRELIPEFYFLPEFLTNRNHFDLGSYPTEGAPITVDDLRLPTWCDSPIDFIYKHRKALESEYVSKHLHEWIDLIFGCKQRSIEANNVYQPKMYKNIWKTKLGMDLDNRPEIEAILMYVGQIPVQLFNEPHPQRIVIPPIGKVTLNQQYSVVTKTRKNTSLKKTVQLDSIKQFKVGQNVEIVAAFCTGFELIYLTNDGFFTLIELNYSEIQKTGKRFLRAARPSVSTIKPPQKILTESNEKKEIKTFDINEELGNSTKPKKQNLPMLNLPLSDITQILPQSFSSRTFVDHPTIPQTVTKESSQTKDLDHTTIKPLIKTKLEELIAVADFSPQFVSPELLVVCNFINDTYAIKINGIMHILNSKNKAKASLYPNLSLTAFKLMQNRNELACIDHDKQYIASFDSDAVLTVYDTNALDKPLFSIPSYRNSIKCLAVSSTFQAVVCGCRAKIDTTDQSNNSKSSLLFCSITDGTFIKSIDLEGKVPKRITISPCWGFVVVHSKTVEQAKKYFHLSVYTINGDKICEEKIENSLIHMTTFRSKSGFDYILCVDAKMNVFAFEAYFLNVGQPVYQSSTPIVYVGFIEQQDAIFVLTRDGNVSLIPFTF